MTKYEYILDVTIPEAKKLFYYDKNEPMEYGVILMYFEIEEWLLENVGNWDHSNVPMSPKPGDTIRFTFETGEDALAFKLRWL